MSDLDEEELKATRLLKNINEKELDELIKSTERSIEETCKFLEYPAVEIEKEKTADEMFKELGYAIKIDNEEEIIYLCIGNEDLDIRFFKKYKVIAGYPTYDYFCDMPLLQAIIKKCKELGWLDE